MNIGTMIVTGVLGLITAAVIYSMVHRHRAGRSALCSDCPSGGCPACGSCGSSAYDFSPILDEKNQTCSRDHDGCTMAAGVEADETQGRGTHEDITGKRGLS